MEKFKHYGLQSFSKTNKTKVGLGGSFMTYMTKILFFSFLFDFLVLPPPHILQKHVSHVYIWNSTDEFLHMSVKCQQVN